MRSYASAWLHAFYYAAGWVIGARFGSQHPDATATWTASLALGAMVLVVFGLTMNAVTWLSSVRVSVRREKEP